MIDRLKKAPPVLLFALTGISFYFSQLAFSLELIAAAAYMTGTSYAVLLLSVSVFTVLLACFLARFLVYAGFRICGAIFTKKSGMLYPFPILYGEFTQTLLSFSVLCFTLCGITGIPVLFFPTLSLVSSAVHSVIQWGFFIWFVLYFVKRKGSDYDRKALTFSLSAIPFVLVCLSMILTIVEVIR